MDNSGRKAKTRKSSPVVKNSTRAAQHRTPVTPVPKSPAKTPDSSKRELKKIEDYWTKNSPVQEDSPRLRSRRKDEGDSKESVATVASAKHVGKGRTEDANSLNNKPKSSKTKEHGHSRSTINAGQNKKVIESLPESPIPGRRRSQYGAGIKHEYKNKGMNEFDDDDDDFVKSHNIKKSSLSVASDDKVQHRNSRKSTPDKHKKKIVNDDCKTDVSKTLSPCENGLTVMKKETTPSSAPTILRDISLITSRRVTRNSPAIQLMPLSDFDVPSDFEDTLSSQEDVKIHRHQSVINTCTPRSDISDASYLTIDGFGDEDYHLPPRKKLRSEVSQEELWDGFPSVTFKRLAPILKTIKGDNADTESTTSEMTEISDAGTVNDDDVPGEDATETSSQILSAVDFGNQFEHEHNKNVEIDEKRIVRKTAKSHKRKRSASRNRDSSKKALEDCIKSRCEAAYEMEHVCDTSGKTIDTDNKNSNAIDSLNNHDESSAEIYSEKSETAKDIYGTDQLPDESDNKLNDNTEEIPASKNLVKYEDTLSQDSAICSISNLLDEEPLLDNAPSKEMVIEVGSKQSDISEESGAPITQSSFSRLNVLADVAVNEVMDHSSTTSEHVITSSEKLAEQSVSQILSCQNSTCPESVVAGVPEDTKTVDAEVPISTDNNNNNDPPEEKSVSCSGSLENIFDLNKLLTNPSDQLETGTPVHTRNTDRQTMASSATRHRTQQSNDNTPLRRSSRLSDISRCKVELPGNSPIGSKPSNTSLNDSVISSTDSSTNDSDDSMTELDSDYVVSPKSESVSNSAKKQGNIVKPKEEIKIKDELQVKEEFEVVKPAAEHGKNGSSKKKDESVSLKKLKRSLSLTHEEKEIMNAFTKTKNKSKLIPPLRIKLKQPLNCKSKKNKQSKSTIAAVCSSNEKDTDDSGLTKEPSTSTSNASAIKCKLKLKLPVIPTNEQRKTPKEAKKSSIKSKTPSEKTASENAEDDVNLKTSSNSKKRTKQRKRCSPTEPCGIGLRLNNERRQSAATDLLSNVVLNRHACVLWSSENRRHVHLSHPGASNSELDNILSEKWDILSIKEKLRYFQRAKDAMKDENRHSSRKPNGSTDNPELSSSSSKLVASSLERFHGLSPTAQMFEIKRWLNFYHEVAPQECVDVMNSFKNQLSEERQERESQEKQMTKKKMSKSKKLKLKLKQQKERESHDNDIRHRNMLYEMILMKKENVTAILTEKKKIQQQFLQDKYNSIVRRLIDGDAISFSGNVTSGRLSETLLDIGSLEKNGKVAVIGSMTTDENLLSNLVLSDEPPCLMDTLESMLDGLDTDSIDDEAKQVEKIPCLSPRTLLEHLTDPNDSSSFEQLDIPMADDKKTVKRSPSSILTEWVTDDVLKLNAHIGFRSAISLLSNKVVQSPAFIMPQSVRRHSGHGPTAGPSSAHDGPSTSGTRVHMNTNQNCNVMYTKIDPSQMSTIKYKNEMKTKQKLCSSKASVL